LVSTGTLFSQSGTNNGWHSARHYKHQWLIYYKPQNCYTEWYCL